MERRTKKDPRRTGRSSQEEGSSGRDLEVAIAQMDQARKDEILSRILTRKPV